MLFCKFSTIFDSLHCDYFVAGSALVHTAVCMKSDVSWDVTSDSFVELREYFGWICSLSVQATSKFCRNDAPSYQKIKLKVKWSRYRPGVAQRVGRGIALLFHDSGTRRGWVVSSTPRPHFTPGKVPVPILQEAGWAPGPVWRAENLVPTGIRSRTVQPVVSRYTDWATRLTVPDN